MINLLKTVELVNEINKKFSKDQLDASIHMTRHDLKVKVFNKSESNLGYLINERVRYFNSENAVGKLKNLNLELQNILDGENG